MNAMGKNDAQTAPEFLVIGRTEPSSGTINSETGPAARREARLVIATLVTRQAARVRANEFARKLRAACAQISRRMQNAACHARREFSCRAWYFSPSLLAWLQRKSGYLT